MSNVETVGIETQPNPFKTLSGKVLVGLGLLSIARVPAAFNEDLSIRDYLPEPFDVPDHIGNVVGTVAVTALFMHGFRRGERKNEDYPATTDLAHKRTRRALAGITAVIAVAANTLAETVGYGSGSTSDPIDFAYGVAAGYLAYKSEATNFVPEGTIRATKQSLEEFKKEYPDDHQLDYLEPILNGQISKMDALKAKFTAKRHVSTSAISSHKKPVTQNKRYTPPKAKR